VWAAQKKSTDNGYFVMKVAASQIKSWGGGKQLKKMTSFFKPPPAKPLTSSLQTSVPKHQKNSDAQEPVGSCAIEDIIDVDAAGLWFRVTILLTHKVPHKVPQTLLNKVLQTRLKGCFFFVT